MCATISSYHILVKIYLCSITEAVIWLATPLTIYLAIRLFALDFYRVIVDEDAARVIYRAIEIESE